MNFTGKPILPRSRTAARAITVQLLGSTLLALAGVSGQAAQTAAPVQWPQFHGINASGVASDDQPAPIPFGLETNLLWQTPTSEGHSSPCIYGDRIFITGHLKENKTLETACVDRATGKVLWRRELKPDKMEKVHRISSPVSATPATDGRLIFVYFGSYGLLAYDFDGGLRWERKLPIPPIFGNFGSGTSPIVAADRVILDAQNGADSHVLALQASDGTVAWKADKPNARGWSTPVVWREEAEECVGVFNAGRFTAYDLKDGRERWWISGLPNQVCATPAVAGDMLFLNGTGVYGELDNFIMPPPFSEALAQYDSNKDGLISADEIPKTVLSVDRQNSTKSGNQNLRGMLFSGNKATKALDEKGWNAALERIRSFAAGSLMTSSVLGVRTGGKGDVSTTHKVWTEAKGVPEVPSPLLYRGRLYFIKNGGVLICRNPKDGRIVFEERVGSPGGYFASPIGAGGQIYVASDTGVITVCAAGDTLKVVSRADLKEPIYATPALVEGRLYARTAKQLIAFGSKPKMPAP